MKVAVMCALLAVVAMSGEAAKAAGTPRDFLSCVYDCAKATVSCADCIDSLEPCADACADPEDPLCWL